MSLIAVATESARRRAEEFIKSGKARLGGIRSTSQGIFYIFADTTDARADDYGSVYDKRSPTGSPASSSQSNSISNKGASADCYGLRASG